MTTNNFSLGLGYVCSIIIFPFPLHQAKQGLGRLTTLLAEIGPRKSNAAQPLQPTYEAEKVNMHSNELDYIYILVHNDHIFYSYPRYVGAFRFGECYLVALVISQLYVHPSLSHHPSSPIAPL